MRLSYSSIETYRQCSLKYKFREIDRLPEEKSKEALFGTIVHSTLKFIHESPHLPPTLEQALDHFSRHWNGERYENELEERAAFADGIQMIQRYYEANDIASTDIVALESRFAIEIGTDKSAPKHIVSGIIDRIDKTPDGYEIIDYKTTRKMPSQDKVDGDLQLSIYLRAFLDRYPKEWERLETLTVSLYFLKHGVKLSSKRTRAELLALDETFLGVVRDIEAGRFEPTLSPLCDWCSFQPTCPLWKHKFVTAETKGVDEETLQNAITELVALQGRQAEDKRRLAELQETILAYMREHGVERVFGNDVAIGQTVRTTYRYDEKRLRALLEPLGQWENVLKVDGTAVKTVLAALPVSVQAEAEKTREKRESRSLSVRKTTGTPGKEELGNTVS
jgi:putative RecB family exonuclease